MSSSSPQQQQQQQRQRKKKRRHPLLYHLLPPTLSLLFLHKFSTSFFLAKRSLPHTSSCSSHAASDLLSTSLGLSKIETDTIGRRILSSSSDKQQDKENGGGRGYDDADDDDGYRDGCWMPRRVASLAVIVVDALRFDFATSHLPKSVGARIAADESSSSSSSRGRSRLLQFVADPPTVTMQRLKGLTTGGLPTFADISKNFGGADIDEDSWVQQMVDVDVKMRGVVVKGGDRRRRRQRRIRTDKMAFVGDDTWVDLFPVQFSSSHPYPSFNTRDLDTVDDGCLFHLPRLLQSFGKKRHSSSSSSSSQKQEEEESYEVVVVHFLGVDHVGHTYGPHDEHMTTKLGQMDDALERILNVLDESEEECQAAFVFGDHGMTEDGNHGGGTPEEVNAGLFAHFSPGCGDMSQSADISGSEIGSASFQSFSSIHQIDLVPTISILLGLPIPYANMGSLVTSLLPPPPPLHNNTSFSSSSSPLTATALALNAAQVWNYLSEYSRHSNAFPPSVLKELKEDLDTAVTVYRSILGRMTTTTTTTTTTKNGGRNEDEDDAMAWREAAGLFKIFLSEANAHGRRVWTTFDSWGMMWGGGGMVMIAMWDLSRRRRRRARCSSSSSKIRLMMSSMESIVTVAFMTFTCVLLPFSNSYIMAESHIVVMTLAVILLGLSYQRRRLRQYAIITIPSSVVIIRPSLLWKSLQQQHLTIPSIIRHHYNLIMGPSSSSSLLLLLIAVGSRCHELIINGHGADASLRRFVAHHPLVFGTSLLCLTAMRYTSSSSSSSDGGRMMTTSRQPRRRRRRHALAMACLAYSWWEKRFAVDGERKGHGSCGVAIFMGVIGLLLSLLQLVPKKQNCVVDERGRRQRRRGGGGDNDDGPALPSSMINNDDPEGIVFDLLIIVMAVTGPSAASSAVVFLVQLRILRYYLLQTTTTTTTTTTAAGSHEMVIPPMIMAALFHLVTRHAFFATNHACAFNHLQTSAAFVVTDVFYYIPAGGMLFLNTFGWEMMGMVYLLAHDDIGCNNSSSSDNNADDDDDDDAARRRQRMRTDDVWEWFVIFQEIQTLGAVVAVSLMRRHLMVWAIFAPKFVFECVFWILRVCFVFVRWRMMMMVCYDDNEAKNSM